MMKKLEWYIVNSNPVIHFYDSKKTMISGNLEDFIEFINVEKYNKINVIIENNFCVVIKQNENDVTIIKIKKNYLEKYININYKLDELYKELKLCINELIYEKIMIEIDNMINIIDYELNESASENGLTDSETD